MSVTHKRTERGQTALEFTLVAPLLLGAIFLIVCIALGWHTHGLASALALEGAAREAVSPGAGTSLLDKNQVPGQLQMGFGPTVSKNGRLGKVYTVGGAFDIPLQPLGFDLKTDIASGALVPIWEFVP
jgi:hypothetical protein